MKKYFIELLGTMFIVLFGCGVAIYTNGNVIATSLAFGLDISTLLGWLYNLSKLCTKHITFNPKHSVQIAAHLKLCSTMLKIKLIKDIIAAIAFRLIVKDNILIYLEVLH